MPNRRTKHNLMNPKKVICRCGREFYPLNHHKKYCSDECKKSFARDWNKIRQEFNKDNPHLCVGCGCNNTGSKYKNCLECRIRHRIYQRNYDKRRFGR